MVEKIEKTAKLFKNGRSQAVRLPKEFRFEGTEVRIRRSGDGVLLEPVGPQIGARDLERVRKVLMAAGPLDKNFSELVDETMRKLEAAAGQ